MADTPEGEFDRLVTRMAELQHKYEGRARSDFFATKRSLEADDRR